MRRMRLIPLVVSAILAMFSLSHAQGWRGLVPLHSTRPDVQRLLGPPKISKGVASTFETKDERVLAFYSNGRCKARSTNEWNVPLGTLLSITIHPNAQLLVKDLKLGTNYERVPDLHAQGVVYYFSKEDGVRISARVLKDNDEDVDSITYEPRLADSHLRCTLKPSTRRRKVGSASSVR